MFQYLWVMVWVALINLPVAFFVTVILFPVWSYIERNYGIESIGHSGPAEWCFWVVYVILMIGGLLIIYGNPKGGKNY